MMNHSFLVYQRLRYLKVSLLLGFAAIIAYVIHQPAEPPNGGTWLGYTLGGISAALMLWLMWFGVRKRSYASHFGVLQGWLSAHVYLGIALILIVSLHAGFQFGWNVHTLAYLLMLLVIASGSYGVFAYLRYPSQMTKNKGGLTKDIMLREINELEQECLSLAQVVDDSLPHTLNEHFQQAELGKTAWQQLVLTEQHTPKIPASLKQHRLSGLEQAGVLEKGSVYDATMFFIAEKIAQTTDANTVNYMRRILELLGRKNALLKRLRRNIQYQALLEFWLYFHVPLSFALLAALFIHVITVFLYW